MFRFERGLCPRNRFLGEVSEGAVEAPSEETPQMGLCHRSGARRSLSTIGPDHRFNRARIWYYLAMKTVSIDQLKRNLSAFIAEAAGGEHIVITRHRRPIASLTRADLEHVHVGSHAGRGALRPLLKSATKGAYLDVLADDRRTRAGRAS